MTSAWRETPWPTATPNSLRPDGSSLARDPELWSLRSRTRNDAAPAPSAMRFTHSLMPGSPDVSAFPRSAWISSARRALTTAPNDAFAAADPRGRVELRDALSGYLGRTRGVRVDPNRIVISASSGHGIALLARTLGGTFAVDAYCLHLHRQLLSDEGIRTVPVSVDESGTCTDELASTAAGATLLTSAHQFPLGGPSVPHGGQLPSNGRRPLAESYWKTTTTANSVTTESPSAHYRIAPQHVAYLGTVSKTLSPAIRIGWMVLPDRLIEPVLAVKGPYERWVSSTDQLALADFIESGRFDSHIRKMRVSYRRRRDQLVAILTQRVPEVGSRDLRGTSCRNSIASWQRKAVMAAANARGLGLEGLSTFRHPDSPCPDSDGIVVGYSKPSPSQYPGRWKYSAIHWNQR